MARQAAVALIEPTPERVRQDRRTRLMIIFGAVVPCVLFLTAMIAWTAVNGLPDQGRGMLGGVLTLGGVAVIGGCYWLADKYWVRRR